MAKRRNVELMVGTFVALGLVALFFLAMQVSNLSLNASSEGYLLQARFANVGSIRLPHRDSVIHSQVTGAGGLVLHLIQRSESQHFHSQAGFFRQRRQHQSITTIVTGANEYYETLSLDPSCQSSYFFCQSSSGIFHQSSRRNPSQARFPLDSQHFRYGYQFHL